MEAEGSRAACALPCLGSSRWRSWEVAFPALQTNGVCKENGEKKGFWAPHPQKSLLPGHQQWGLAREGCSRCQHLSLLGACVSRA